MAEFDYIWIELSVSVMECENDLGRLAAEGQEGSAKMKSSQQLNNGQRKKT